MASKVNTKVCCGEHWKNLVLISRLQSSPIKQLAECFPIVVGTSRLPTELLQIHLWILTPKVQWHSSCTQKTIQQDMLILDCAAMWMEKVFWCVHVVHALFPFGTSTYGHVHALHSLNMHWPLLLYPTSMYFSAGKGWSQTYSLRVHDRKYTHSLGKKARCITHMGLMIYMTFEVT